MDVPVEVLDRVASANFEGAVGANEAFTTENEFLGFVRLLSQPAVAALVPRVTPLA